MPHAIPRRRFLQAALAASPLLNTIACRIPGDRRARSPARAHRLLFTSQGRTAMIHADGSSLRYFKFDRPNQATWQPGPFFSDGRRVIFLSMEPRRDGPGRPFEEYYTQTPTHLWVHDLDAGTLSEIAAQHRLAVFYTPALLIRDERILVQVVRNKVGQIFSMNLDGSDARPFTQAGEGLPYGLGLSPDGRRVAFHLASPRGYEVWTSDVEGGNRALVAGHPDHLYFGPTWSPDGEWLVYQDCLFKQDPAHDWADLCLSRPDGRERRLLTNGQTLWFGATYGSPATHGGGSNVPVWTPDGAVLCCVRSPGSRVPWEFQSQRPDTDHFNREFKPGSSRGGTAICRIDPRNGSNTPLTPTQPAVWDFRASGSSDGDQVVFCRAETGGVPAIWVMNADGLSPRLLTRGLEDQGADHPRWVPQPRASSLRPERSPLDHRLAGERGSGE